MCARILVTVTDSCGFTLLELAFARADEVDVDLDVFADELLPQKLARLNSIMCLTRVRLPKRS